MYQEGGKVYVITKIQDTKQANEQHTSKTPPLPQPRKHAPNLFNIRGTTLVVDPTRRVHQVARRAHQMPAPWWETVQVEQRAPGVEGASDVDDYAGGGFEGCFGSSAKGSEVARCVGCGVGENVGV